MSWWLRVTMALVAWMIAAAATPDNEAARLYERGNYLEAASLAAAAETASSFALAARATLTHAIYVADRTQRAAEVQRAVDLARKALTLDPGQVEAHLQLVIALHQQARAATPFSAYLQGYAGEARDHLDTVLSLDPDNPWAQSLLGGWHFEIVRLAGSTLAHLLLEADLAEGRTAFAKAIALMPGSIVLQYEFARALLLSDSVTNRTKAVHALEAALAETPISHLDKLMAVRARATLDAVKSGSSELLRRTLDPDQ